MWYSWRTPFGATSLSQLVQYLRAEYPSVVAPGVRCLYLQATNVHTTLPGDVRGHDRWAGTGFR